MFKFLMNSSQQILVRSVMFEDVSKEVIRDNVQQD